MALSRSAVETYQWGVLLGPFAALSCNVLVQILLVRARAGTHFLRSNVEAFLSGGLVLAATNTFLLRACPESNSTIHHLMMNNILLYISLSYCFYHFVNMGHSSLRLRIFQEVAKQKNGISLPDISNFYNERTLLSLRLQRLNESGDVVERDGRFFVARSRLIIISRLIVSTKYIILGKWSEFE